MQRSTIGASKNCTSSMPTTFTPKRTCDRSSSVFLMAMASSPRLSREMIRFTSKRLSIAGLKICERCRAISARRMRRISSSLLPLNIPPVITSIHPPLGFTPSISSLHSLIKLALQFAESSNGERIFGIQINRRFVLAERVENFSFRLVDSTEIEMRIKVSLVSVSFKRALKPRDRSVMIAFFYQVSADVVIRVSKIRVNLNRRATLFDGFVRHAHEGVSPAEKRVSFGGRIRGYGLLVEVSRTIKIAAHLGFVSLLKKIESLALCRFLFSGQRFFAAKRHIAYACVERDNPPLRIALSGLSL